jgi:hypothetical protein
MTSAPALLDYTFHESHVHEFVLHNIQPATLDAFFAKLGQIVESTSPGETVRLLIHTSQISFVQYAASHRKTLKQKYPHFHRPRIAIVYPRSLQIHFLNMVARAMTHSATLRMFHTDQVAEALEWVAQ